MKKIIITDSVDKKSVEILNSAGFEVNYSPGLPKEEIKKIINQYHGLIVRSDTKVTSDLIDFMDNMEVIGRAGAGVDNIDISAATRKGIIVMNTPGGNTISTAEHTFTLLLSLCRNIPQADASMRAGRWDRKKYKGTELFGKTIGIIGLGKIGREIAIRSKAFGMNVIGYDPILTEETANKLGIKLVELDELFNSSDFITLHVPLNEKTKNLISHETLAKCKDGVKIINCARGGIVDENAIVDKLNSGKVSGAAFDVYTTEPPDFNHELIKHPKVVLTPHLGASTDEAQEKVAIQIAEQIVELFTNKKVYGAVNATAFESIGKKELIPYVHLAEKMGLLLAQIIKGRAKQMNISFAGELLNSSTELISAAFVKGFLSFSHPDPINLINAGYLAKESGISINEIKADQNPDYTNLLSVECLTEQGKNYLSGTVFGNTECRIVNIDNFKLELNPEGNLIIYSNIDKPGMLATVGKILADGQINIAGLSLGRTKAGGEALTIINVDSPVNEEIFSKIISTSGVKDVLTVKI